MENKNQIEIDTVKLCSETKEILKDNSVLSNYKNDILKSVNTNIDNNECYALKRYTFTNFQT